MINKALPLFILLSILIAVPLTAQVKIGDNPHVVTQSALLELDSRAQGFLLPRMTTEERDAIATPAKGLLIFNTITNQIEVNFGTPQAPDWNATFSAATGLAITSQDTARWNLNAGWTVRVSPTGDTLYLPQGGSVIVPGASQLNYPSAPNVRTRSAGRLSTSSVLASGEILNDGGRPVLQRGFVWGSASNPALGVPGYTAIAAGSGTGVFQSTLTDLSASTTYYIRAYAINARDTAYGEVLSFTVSVLQGQVTDIDGNVYKTVKIGPLNWMAENLKATRFANGDPITVATTNDAWTSNALVCADYNFSAANGAIFGKLYKFFVAADPRNICPTGWHVATFDEYGLLSSTSEVQNLAQHVRAVETLGNGGYWFEPNYDVTNRSGFTALPGGIVTQAGGFTGKNIYAGFWTSTWWRWGSRFIIIENRQGIGLGGDEDDIGRGHSIRCVQDY